VLTSRQIRQFSPNFSRTKGSEVIEKWEGKDRFSPLASKSRGTFTLPALQLVPPLIKLTQSRNPGIAKTGRDCIPYTPATSVK